MWFNSSTNIDNGDYIMSEEAISKFIAECAAAGINQPEAIRQRALDAIQEIDVKLLEADKLRPLRANMVAVIRSPLL